jgi:hypothetical protein
VRANKVVAGMHLIDQENCPTVTDVRPSHKSKNSRVDISSKSERGEPPCSGIWTVKADQMVRVKE